ncbi:hypothetical protein [Crenothrix polyspora]|uniref:Uncharacterized protein n=1 Tax=Crenothrix polyspora TaxID=360316 RepID=A0A1R4HIH5_9GAMM|nr:hypothetical protein [Crenothrix polyspora]SJM96027.1 hypothetical protein CRENPOLYSF1_830019 [Crenothrix polyspora]
MRIKYNEKEGLNMDIPYSGWLMFCLGLAVVFVTLPDIITALSHFISMFLTLHK